MRKEYSYNKLVRDNIPDIVSKKSQIAVYHYLDEEDYYVELKRKLLEEIDEFLKNEYIEELADILEVIKALVDLLGYSESFEAIRERKAKEKGRFNNRIFLEKVVEIID